MPGLINALSEEELEKLPELELGEDTKQVQNDVQVLKEWIRKSPHLQQIKKDDAFLKVFLRGCKYSLERTKEKIDFFYSVRTSLPEWFSDWNPKLSQLQKVLKAGICVPLHGYDKHGRYTLLMKMSSFDPNNMKLDDMLKCNMMIMELAMKDNLQAQLKGIVIVQDMSGMTAAHATQLSISLAKKMTTVFQDAYPSQPKAFHVLNLPGAMETIYNMMQSLQKQKMRERHHLHPKGDYSKLVEDLGADILPKEYGGTNSTLPEISAFWKTELERNSDWLLQQTKFRTEEGKRPGKPRLHSDIFGIEGSFRKLEID